MQRTPKKKKSMAVWIALCLAILLVLGIDLISSIRKLDALNRERQEVQAQLEELQEENETLRQKIEKTETDGYIIRIARQVLGWVFPGEIRIAEEEGP